MRTPRPAPKSLRHKIGSPAGCPDCFLWGRAAGVSLGSVLGGTSLGSRVRELSSRSVLLAFQDQLAAALGLIVLDGVAKRLIICPPDLPPEYRPGVIEKANVDAIVTDIEPAELGELGVPTRVIRGFQFSQECGEPPAVCPTEWVLLTSGTSGVPKMIFHTLETLTGSIGEGMTPGVVWGTFYDIRRYGGLQILLRALLGHASLVLSGPGEALGDYLLRLGRHGATHVSGTPSHWRRVLMSPYARVIKPRYVRLSGEIVDQGILDALSAFYPQAAIRHAFASTEAGVAFEVTDGLAGFPARMVGARGGPEIRIEEGSLRVRSTRVASRAIGGEDGWVDSDGFVDTGDLVELRGDRYHFLGRRNGVINVGGLKVYPEEIEAVINRHPAVRMSRVRSRRNPILGSLVEADVVLADSASELDPWQGGSASSPHTEQYKREILQSCRESLAAHKVPATVHCVAELEVTAAGKLRRNHA